jgi:G3E family GTPase
MEKTTAGLIGALAGLATMGTANAASQPPAQLCEQVMRVASYADLLKPIPNAADILRSQQAEPRLLEAQYYQDQRRPEGHHHHHHHHHYYPPPPRHHHHHHHHHHHDNGGAIFVVPGLGAIRTN